MKEKSITITITEDDNGLSKINREFKGMTRFEIMGILFDTMHMVQNSKKEPDAT
jgi:hypothetical protein